MFLARLQTALFGVEEAAGGVDRPGAAEKGERRACDV